MISAEPDQQRQQELEHLLRQDCGSCHGMTLQGGLGPSILPNDLEALDPVVISSIILEGRAGTAMPPWKYILSETDAQWLAKRLKQGAEIE